MHRVAPLDLSLSITWPFRTPCWCQRHLQIVVVVLVVEVRTLLLGALETALCNAMQTFNQTVEDERC